MSALFVLSVAILLTVCDEGGSARTLLPLLVLFIVTVVLTVADDEARVGREGQETVGREQEGVPVDALQAVVLPAGHGYRSHGGGGP